MNIETVWSEYRSGLKAFLHSKVSDPDEVDDLLQDILIKTYNNLHTVRSQKSVKSWLFQIANHAIIDFYRKRGREPLPEGETLWYEESQGAHQEPGIQQELSGCLQPFIQALSEESAHLLSEIDLMEKPQKAYAQEHNIHYSTLKSRVQKARGELKELFESCCHLTLDKDGNVADCVLKDHCTAC